MMADITLNPEYDKLEIVVAFCVYINVLFAEHFRDITLTLNMALS